jgi:hypothetical protein
VDNIPQILEEKLPFVEIIEDLPQSSPKTPTKMEHNRRHIKTQT